MSDALSGADPQVGQVYFCVFMRTMQREWHGIDRLRLDKFLVLVRCFVRALFGHLRSSGWCASFPSVWHAQCRGWWLALCGSLLAFFALLVCSTACLALG